MKLPNSRKLKYPFRNYFSPLWNNNNLMTKNGVSPNSEIGGDLKKLKFEMNHKIADFTSSEKKLLTEIVWYRNGYSMTSCNF